LKILFLSRDIPVKGDVLPKGEADRNHHGAKFSSHPGNSAYTRTWGPLHCSPNISTPFFSGSAFPLGKEPDSIGILFAVSNVCDVKFCVVGKATGIPQQ